MKWILHWEVQSTNVQPMPGKLKGTLDRAWLPPTRNSQEERGGLLDAVGLRKEVLVTNPPRKALICLSQGKCKKFFKDCLLKESFLPQNLKSSAKWDLSISLPPPPFSVWSMVSSKRVARTRFVLGNGRTFKTKFWILTIVWIWTLYVLN